MHGGAPRGNNNAQKHGLYTHHDRDGHLPDRHMVRGAQGRACDRCRIWDTRWPRGLRCHLPRAWSCTVTIYEAASASFANWVLLSGFRLVTASIYCIYIVSTSRRSVMIVEFRKWGNSLAVRIPKALADIIKVSDGKRAEIKIENGALVLRPIVKPARKPSYTLDELLSGMTRDDVPEQVDWGLKRGNEAW